MDEPERTGLFLRYFLRGLAGVLDAIGFVASLIFAIPVLGRSLRQIWDFLIDLAWRVLSIPGLIIDSVGFRWRKKYRVCLLIVDDGGPPVATDETLAPAIASARDIFKEHASVDLIIESVGVVETNHIAQVGVNFQAWVEDLWTKGSVFEYMSSRHHFRGAGRRLVGFAAPVVVFVVREVEGASGCSLGQFSDYVTVEGPKGGALAHELGHACGLWHHKSRDNLMRPRRADNLLHEWQVAMIRSSRHVTYW